MPHCLKLYPALRVFSPGTEAESEADKLQNELRKSREAKEQFDLDMMLSSMMSLHMRLVDKVETLHHFDSETAFNLAVKTNEEAEVELYDTLAKLTTALTEELYSTTELDKLVADQGIDATKSRVTAMEGFRTMKATIEIERIKLLSGAAEVIRKNQTMESRAKNLDEVMRNLIGSEFQNAYAKFEDDWKKKRQHIFDGISTKIKSCRSAEKTKALPRSYGYWWEFFTCKPYSECASKYGEFLVSENRTLKTLGEEVNLKSGFEELLKLIQEAYNIFQGYSDECKEKGNRYEGPLAHCERVWDLKKPCDDLKDAVEKEMKLMNEG